MVQQHIQDNTQKIHTYTKILDIIAEPAFFKWAAAMNIPTLTPPYKSMTQGLSYFRVEKTIEQCHKESLIGYTLSVGLQ